MQSIKLGARSDAVIRLTMGEQPGHSLVEVVMHPLEASGVPTTVRDSVRA